METKLSLITQKAREDKKCRFTSLVHLLNEESLKECYRKLRRNGARGIDNVSWREYGEKLDENLRALVGNMKAMRYRPQTVKRVYIPKGNNKKRALGIPATEDKIVQYGIMQILEAIYEQDFLNCSYGFRPNRSAHNALKEIDRIIMSERTNHIIEADIKGFFDNIDHEWLMKCLEVRIADRNLLRLIKRFMKAGYVEEGKKYATNEGTPQGGNLSPLLANIFLHYVLDLWFEKIIKPQMKGKVELIRYADDFIILAQYQEEASRIEEMLKERFRKFRLELHQEKTRRISFGRYEKEKAEKQDRKANTFNFLGFTHYWGKSRNGKIVLKRKTEAKKYRNGLKEMNRWLKMIRNKEKIGNWWKILISKIRGHIQYYGISDNTRSLNRYYERVLKIVFKWINRRSQKMSMNWEKYKDYVKRHPLPKPRIIHSFYAIVT